MFAAAAAAAAAALLPDANADVLGSSLDVRGPVLVRLSILLSHHRGCCAEFVMRERGCNLFIVV